jgi:hypothetical protein
MGFNPWIYKFTKFPLGFNPKFHKVSIFPLILMKINGSNVSPSYGLECKKTKYSSPNH